LVGQALSPANRPKGGASMASPVSSMDIINALLVTSKSPERCSRKEPIPAWSMPPATSQSIWYRL
jgi:hypothetical protein